MTCYAHLGLYHLLRCRPALSCHLLYRLLLPHLLLRHLLYAGQADLHILVLWEALVAVSNAFGSAAGSVQNISEALETWLALHARGWIGINCSVHGKKSTFLSLDTRPF